ncbi:hypothetical protein KKF91_12600 [Myxococcota bacterium]|nr:hypothetical protein [Myxococcota bacterium]MBU1431373.1 hypothetical protein [Myxococcota bacterium]MBU1898380.1 hypothetical protein [Myxococcota bacterium]
MLTYDGEFIREYTSGRLINEWATAGLPIGEGEAMVIGGSSAPLRRAPRPSRFTSSPMPTP